MPPEAALIRCSVACEAVGHYRRNKQSKRCLKRDECTNVTCQIRTVRKNRLEFRLHKNARRFPGVCAEQQSIFRIFVLS